MSTTTNFSVAIAGASGNLGPSILTNLLSAQFPVTVLTRVGSTSTSKLPSNPLLTIKEVDYTSVPSLKSALAGITAVISNLGGAATSQQNPLIDASIAAGVKRFIPSEFGSNLALENVRALPVFAGKVATQEYLKSKVSENPEFSYTFIYNNAFFDWGLRVGFIVNLKSHTARLYDGGDRPVSMTRLDAIGKAVVGVLNNLSETANREVYVHETVLSQKEIIAIAKEIDGKEWETTEYDLIKGLNDSLEKLKGGKPEDVGPAILGTLLPAPFAEGYGNDYSLQADNELLGVKMLSREEVKEVIRGILEE
jgi:putative NADH-flavin reductase